MKPFLPMANGISFLNYSFYFRKTKKKISHEHHWEKWSCLFNKSLETVYQPSHRRIDSISSSNTKNLMVSHTFPVDCIWEQGLFQWAYHDIIHFANLLVHKYKIHYFVCKLPLYNFDRNRFKSIKYRISHLLGVIANTLSNTCRTLSIHRHRETERERKSKRIKLKWKKEEIRKKEICITNRRIPSMHRSRTIN